MKFVSCIPQTQTSVLVARSPWLGRGLSRKTPYDYFELPSPSYLNAAKLVAGDAVTHVFAHGTDVKNLFTDQELP
ncbi:hypothetical protein pdam_00009508, partial [Pocillopora damicornis]